MRQWKRIYLVGIFFLVVATIVANLSLTSLQKDEHNITGENDYSKAFGVIKHDVASLAPRYGQMWIQPSGVGVGFVWQDEKDIPPQQRSQTEEVKIASGESFHPLLLLHSPRETTLLISVLLDYKQVEFTLNDKKGLLHELVVKPDGDLQIPMNVEIPEPGQHDLLVIAFYDPWNYNLDPVARSEQGITVGGRRAVIYSGEVSTNINEMPQAMEGKPVPSNVFVNLGVSFAEEQNIQGTNIHPSERQLYVGVAKSGMPYPYQIWVSNLQQTRSAKIVLLQFQNYHQIPIQNQTLALVGLNKDEEIFFSESTLPSGKVPVDLLQIVYIYDPYKSLLNEEVMAPFVFGSPRLAIKWIP